MPISATPRPSGSPGNQPAVTNGKALAVVTTIFFMWGFLTCLNDILIPHLKAVFELNYAKAMLVQFTFFGAYFLVSLPAGSVVSRIGYKPSIVIGLFVYAVVVAKFRSFSAYAGIVALNPLVRLVHVNPKNLASAGRTPSDRHVLRARRPGCPECGCGHNPPPAASPLPRSRRPAGRHSAARCSSS